MSYAPPSVRKFGTRSSERGIIVYRAPAIPHSALRAPQLPGVFLARFNTCLDCPWNLDWTCQHAGCKVCPGKQKQTGADPLKHLLAEPFFKCPLKKF